MVFGNLVENRICYKSDGPSGGGDSNRGVERGRTNQPPAQAGPANPSPRPQQPQDFNDDRAGRGAPTPVTNALDPGSRATASEADMARRTADFFAAPTYPGGQNFSSLATIEQMQDALTRQAGGGLTDREMLAVSASAPDPFAAPSGGGIPAGSMPGSGNAEQAAIVEALVNKAAQQSYANGGTDARNTVQGAAGRRDAESGFFADAYDELYGGNAPGTFADSILSDGILGNLFNAPDAADSAAFRLGQMQRLAQTSQTGTVDPKTGAVTGVRAGPGRLSMNALGGVVYSGMNDPNYTGLFQDLVRGTANNNRGSGDNQQSNNQMAAQQPDAPIDPGTTTPEQIDDLAVNYLQNPYYLYSGQNNLFQPYGYAGGTLVDLLQTRNMQMPGQAAPDLGLFGNPRDFR